MESTAGHFMIVVFIHNADAGSIGHVVPRTFVHCLREDRINLYAIATQAVDGCRSRGYHSVGAEPRQATRGSALEKCLCRTQFIASAGVFGGIRMANDRRIRAVVAAGVLSLPAKSCRLALASVPRPSCCSSEEALFGDRTLPMADQ